jgi:crotonobetainyl-CoA:carnitine CoA-transferase CaiB-like acyl-CoA transferase
VSAYAGLRIVDFSQGVAGPMASMLLGDFEAEVVKVEPPSGDRIRDLPGYFAFNRNKRVLTLDLERKEGLEMARKLITGADVAIFDSEPGALGEKGLDAASLTQAHPGLIHAWTPPYGTRGRWSHLPARHNLLTAVTGVAFRQGAFADQPVHLILPILWYAQGVTTAAAIGAALFERSRSGRGQGLVVSGLHGTSEATGPVRALAQPPLPRGQPGGTNPHYRLYQCADGKWLFLATLFIPFYRKAFEALGLADRFSELQPDPAAARPVLEALFLSRPRDEWLEVLKAHDVPCGPAAERADWFAGETIATTGMRLAFAHAELGEVAMPAPPAKLSVTRAQVRALPEPICAAPAWPERKAYKATVNGHAPPLAGVRVLNLGTVIAGAYSGTLLANLGADVIKIEPKEADPFRSDGPGFQAYNRGQRGLGLDLKQPAAKALFLDLVRGADVVIDNYRFGVRQRLGIAYAELKAVNPRIISCSVNAYGETGPRAPLPGFDPLLQAEGGMMAGQGGDGEPILHTIAVNDIATAGVVTMAVIAALNARTRTGEGQEVLTSLMAQSLLFQLGEVTTYEGRPDVPAGGRDCLGVRALERFYACADGWLALSAETSSEAQGVGDALGVDVGDPAQALEAPRDGVLAQAIEAAMAGRMRHEALEALAAAGVPAAPALRAAEAFESEWLWDNGFLEMWSHPRLGEMIGVRGYADFERTPGGFACPTPDLGEHTRQILAEAGLLAERIDELFAAGAVFEPAKTTMAPGEHQTLASFL